jgi:hypothetical protein
MPKLLDSIFCSVEAPAGWASLITLRIDAAVNLSMLPDEDRVRLINSLRRNMYSGTQGKMLDLFEFLCIMHKIPYVLKGTREAFFPIDTSRGSCEEFVSVCHAMMSLQSSQNPESQRPGKRNISGLETKMLNTGPVIPGHYRHECMGYPCVKVQVPDQGWDGIVARYEAFRPPSNQPGINAAVKMLKGNSWWKVDFNYTEDYKGERR